MMSYFAVESVEVAYEIVIAEMMAYHHGSFNPPSPKKHKSTSLLRSVACINL